STFVSSCQDSTFLTGLSCQSMEEADGRILLHAWDLAAKGAKTIVIRTVDTDVVVLAISFFFTLKTEGLQELWVLFGVGKKQRYIAAHAIADVLGAEKATALRGFHAFTGCDTVSSFATKGKK